MRGRAPRKVEVSMRDLIRQVVKFDDIFAAYPKRITAEIIIDKTRGLCMFNADDYVSVDAFAYVMYANKQIRKLTTSRRIYQIESYDTMDYYVKKNVYFDGPVEIYDRDYILTFGDDGVKRTGWFSFTELDKICSCSMDDEYRDTEPKHYKQVLRSLGKRGYNFEYCEIKEV